MSRLSPPTVPSVPSLPFWLLVATCLLTGGAALGQSRYAITERPVLPVAAHAPRPGSTTCPRWWGIARPRSKTGTRPRLSGARAR